MKNKQINKFVFMFVIGLSLLFSYSNAAIFEANVSYSVTTGSSVSKTQTDISSDLTAIYPTYKESLNYYLSTDTREQYTEWFNEFKSYIYSTYDKNAYMIYYCYNGYRIFFYNRNEIEFAFNKTSEESYVGADVYLALSNGDNLIYINRQPQSCASYSYTFSVDTVWRNTSSSYKIDGYKYFECEGASIKTFLNNMWDGTSYYQKIEEKPEGPEISSVNHDLAGLITAITSSDVIKDNKGSQRDEFFIIPFGSVSGKKLYDVYFYHPYLELSMFEYLSNDEKYYYDLDKTLVNGALELLSNIWGEEKLGGTYFSLVYDEETKSADIVYNGGFSFVSYDVRGFSSEENPIIYTTKDIRYIYSKKDETTGNWIGIPDISKDMKPEIITDSEGNEVSPTIDDSLISINNTPWSKVVSLVNDIPKKIISIITDSTGLSRISIIVNPLIEAIRLILGVLLSSISLLSRAVTFVYILPTIEPSNALFLADVDTTIGLNFAGNSWGIKFLEGLNMVKEFSWNGLNLWTLFTSFIVAMFAIHCIKLVRKHYHY